MIEQRLTELKKKLTEYSALVESMLAGSMRAILQRDHAALHEIIERDETRANEFENELDEMGANLIAQYEPKARDLRVALMSLRMNNDLERMADHVVNIAGSGLYLVDSFASDSYALLHHMSLLVGDMLKDSINAYFHEEPSQARQVFERDAEVDQLGRQLLGELTNRMGSQSDQVRHSLHLLRIASNLERIADLSTNICEEIIFIVEGKNVKHHAQDSENPTPTHTTDSVQ
jgi:phosphate transport system protein